MTALCFQLSAIHAGGKRVQNLALASSAPENQKQLLKADAKLWGEKSNNLTLVGLCFAALGIFCLVVSYRKREPAWRLILIGLLAFYLLLQFVLV